MPGAWRGLSEKGNQCYISKRFLWFPEKCKRKFFGFFLKNGLGPDFSYVAL